MIVGGADVGAAFARLPLDHLIFTGSTTVGRHIMRAAAENLVPVTLELGGKSPVIVGESASIAKTATSLAFGKMMNGGQLCLSPDYALLPRGREDEFVNAFAGEIRSMYPTVFDNPDFTGVFNDAHFARLAGYIEDARKKGARVTIVNPIEHAEQQASRRMPVHILQDVTEDMAVMQDEIFGPLLPIMSYDDIADAVSFVARRAKPLGLYYFGEDKEEEAFVVDNTQSGGVTVNDVLLHYAQEDLPFGGIGPSGWVPTMAWPRRVPDLLSRPGCVKARRAGDARGAAPALQSGTAAAFPIRASPAGDTKTRAELTLGPRSAGCRCEPMKRTNTRAFATASVCALA